MNKIANKPAIVTLANAILAAVEGDEAKAVKLCVGAIADLTSETVKTEKTVRARRTNVKKATARKTVAKKATAKKATAKKSATHKGVHRGPTPSLTTTQVAELLKRKNAGEKVEVLAKDAGVGVQTVYRSLSKLRKANERDARVSAANARAQAKKDSADATLLAA